MNSKMLKAMRPKKKREVDPNAPPRPNLMSHDVKIRQQNETMETMFHEIQKLKDTIRRLENRLNNQQTYLEAVHQRLRNK